MANLSYSERATLEKLFDMQTGYVIDFSNASFALFIGDITGIDIYQGEGYKEYASKANKLRQIWDEEPDVVVGKLLEALLKHLEDYELSRGTLSQDIKNKINDMRSVAQRLKDNLQDITLPNFKEETLNTLLKDINSALSRHKPELVLDRLHTFSVKFLRKICIDNGISLTDKNGNYYPLQSIAGMIKKKYEQESIFQSTFTLMAIQSSISLFDKYNAIMNNQSYAHDNYVLNSIEAEFAVRMMANLLTFIEYIEKIRKEQVRARAVDISDCPFF